MTTSADSGDTNWNESVREYVLRPDYQPVTASTLAKRLKVTKRDRRAFREAVESLTASGVIRVHASGRINPPIPSGLIAGVIRKRASGAGVLLPHPPHPPGVSGEIAIAPRDMGDAHNGDEVLVRLLSRRGPGGRRTAEVVDVVERATNVFVGTYFEEADQGYVQIDGTGFADPVWVGDPGAKGAREGDKVVIEMVRFPTQHRSGEAVLTEVLGPRGDPGVDTLSIIREFGLPDKFPEEVLAEAHIAAENFDPENLEGRVDLTHEIMVTIDPVDARDFDDAISLKQSDDGHWHLGVHIADVSHFVTPGSALDAEAHKRGTSVYLPGRVIPMLPEVISNALASLQERQVRFAKSAFIEFTAEGTPVHVSFASTAIKVTKRLTYEQVLPLMHGEQTGKRVPAKVRQLICRMHEFAMLMRRRRFERGAINLSIPEIKLDFDQNGAVCGAHETVHDESHQIIEEFMLAANIAVATHLAQRGIEFLRRNHGDPSEAKMKAFAEFVSALGFRLRRPQSRPELQALLDRVAGKPEERAINYALLRSFKPADYSPMDIGHYALAEPNYCHFTSPIRRYPDLTIHRWIDALIEENPTYQGPRGEQLFKLGRHCSATERRAAEAERELVQVRLLNHLANEIGTELDAVITGVDRFGFFCRGTKLPADGLVHVTSLAPRDYYDYDRTAQQLVARRSGERFRLGDAVRVRVARVDVDRRELDFQLVRHSERRNSGGSSPRSRPSIPRPGTKRKSKPRKKKRGR